MIDHIFTFSSNPPDDLRVFTDFIIKIRGKRELCWVENCCRNGRWCHTGAVHCVRPVCAAVMATKKTNALNYFRWFFTLILRFSRNFLQISEACTFMSVMRMFLSIIWSFLRAFPIYFCPANLMVISPYLSRNLNLCTALMCVTSRVYGARCIRVATVVVHTRVDGL